MPRIISGRNKGLKLFSPAGAATRPTADQVKEAVFSMLQSLPLNFEGLRVLDYFAGSGSLGLEALSRGAAFVVLADSDKSAAEAVRRNLEKMGAKPGAAMFLKTRWPAGFQRLAGSPPFDLFFLDPPYQEQKLPLDLLKEAAAQGLAAPGAVAVWEQAPQTLAAWAEADLGPWQLVKTRTRGRQSVAIFRKSSGPDEVDR